ncbi:amino-acid N-acetyltransferase [Vigna unguiculata]|uniref:Amino-acid N-acetyltransferase n=1 Tax=Vigna unguiculata TaxID=3917 RepID=A0A4D6LST1_VIGUN|nr:amino-acid N-acetyltransferase [Vigna unguiculata]
MATATSKATISVPFLSHGSTPNFHFLHLLSPLATATVPRRSCTFRSHNNKTTPLSPRDCGCHQSRAAGEDFGISEEDEEFVNVLRESQSYVLVHRASVFVVLISAEVVASPYLDPILKVSHRSAFSLSIKSTQLNKNFFFFATDY